MDGGSAAGRRGRVRQDLPKWWLSAGGGRKPYVRRKFKIVWHPSTIGVQVAWADTPTHVLSISRQIDGKFTGLIRHKRGETPAETVEAMQLAEAKERLVERVMALSGG